jgi:hypothetical protein
MEVPRKLANLPHTSCPASWNGPARHNLWHGLSSCSLVILGFAHLHSEWYSVGCVLCFQAVASYMSDVWNCGLCSFWHGVDEHAALVSAGCGLRFLVLSTRSAQIQQMGGVELLGSSFWQCCIRRVCRVLHAQYSSAAATGHAELLFLPRVLALFHHVH